MAVRAYALEARPGVAPGAGFAIIDFQKSGPTVVYADRRAGMTPLGHEPYRMRPNALAGAAPSWSVTRPAATPLTPAPFTVTAFGIRRTPIVPSPVKAWGGLAPTPAPAASPVIVAAPAVPSPAPAVPAASPLPPAPFVGPAPVDFSPPAGSSSATPAAASTSSSEKPASSLPGWLLPAAIGAVVLIAGIGFATKHTSH
jgi:hypothetical protein